MSISIKTGKIGAVLAVAASIVVGVSAVAQPPAGAPPGGGQGGGRRGGGMGRGMGQMTLSQVPASVLADGLKLNAVQTAKIKAIQDQYRKDTQALRPAQGAPPTDFQEMRQKFQALNDETNKSIEGVLTADQNAKAPAFLKSVGGYRAVGIPLEVLPDLKLTADQKTKIQTISTAAQKQMQDAFAANQGGGGQGGGGGFQAIQEIMKTNSDKAAAVLTAAQKATLDKYKADHPQRGFGGPGGGGRRGGGAPGGGAARGGNGPA